MAKIEIDKSSGFCFGVVNAIKKAEEELDKTGILYCLGDIVHNNNEVERLKAKGLISINHEEFSRLKNVKVLLRAHGEPPETYRIARENGIEIIDATCPVVLQLQRKINKAYRNSNPEKDQIIIYGKMGHAEVNGLVGQTNGQAIVIEDCNDLSGLDFRKKTLLYAQTTKSVDGFKKIVTQIKQQYNSDETFEYFDTICRQVANRIPNIRDFARLHEIILFVCGKKSSNGKVLFEECCKVNKNTHLVSDISEIDMNWFSGKESIGICGATSTPKWLMEEVYELIQSHLEQ